MYPITPVPKTYSWGSTDRLQGIFGVGEGGPLAEMWFSGHPASPSTVDVAGEAIDLDEAIRRAPDLMVGSAASEEWGPVLPYLFKIISARIPLSLQVHPVDFEARAGYNRENAAGVPIDSPVRSFKDSLAKHEMVVALEPFEASVGFASRSTALAALRAVDHPLAAAMAALLKDEEPSRRNGILQPSGADDDMPAAARVWGRTQRRVFRAFREAVTAPPDAADGLTEAIAQGVGKCTNKRAKAGLAHSLAAARAFPGDPSVLTVAMLNAVSLDYGESVFIPAGTPHCYLHGTGAEIMTNSDNVLRAGMTVKHKDIPNLLRNLDCSPAPPIDPLSHALPGLLTRDLAIYRPRLREFMLSFGHVGADGDTVRSRMTLLRRSTVPQYVQGSMPAAMVPAAGGPRVLVCISGTVVCRTAAESVPLAKGQAVFIPAGDGRAQVTAADDGAEGVYLMASTRA